MLENKRFNKWLYYILVVGSFIVIFAFNYLTPLMSDDLSYGAQARQANNLWDLVLQEYNQYMTWIGRSVCHMILRIFLCLPAIVFKIANSVAYIVLSLLIYENISSRKRYDPMMFCCVQIGLWLFAVDFRQTILWETGACNYLWATMIILAFMTFVRRVFYGTITPHNPFSLATRVRYSVTLLLFGIVAGWCSENTSGACLLYLLILLGIGYRKYHKVVYPVLCGAIGNLIGLLFMVLAPGNAERGQYRTELHSGLYGMVSRFQKITLIIRQYFFILLALYMILWITIWILDTRRDRREKFVLLRRPLLFLFLFIATCYALIMTTATQPRAFFGAGVFLLIAVLQEIRILLDVCWVLNLRTPRIILYSGAAILSMYLAFVIFDCGAKVARIYRDVNERVSYIAQAKENGEDEVTIAQVHTSFYNDYSAVPENELSDDPDYWTNVGYEEYYGVERIIALPYDDWLVYMGEETEEEAEASKALIEETSSESIINSLPGWN